MNKLLSAYKALVFDCDGVILDSNKAKTNAFYKTALPYGENQANELVNYHIANGGISRYEKFKHFVTKISPKKNSNVTGPYLDELIYKYSKIVKNELINCQVAEGINELKNITQEIPWFIVSGGDQNELREVFMIKGLADLFDGGIYGSPDDKNTIFLREISQSNIKKPALFIGDSKYDYQSAQNAEIDFVFLYKWSEVKNWKNWCQENNITYIKDVKSIL